YKFGKDSDAYSPAEEKWKGVGGVTGVPWGDRLELLVTPWLLRIKKENAPDLWAEALSARSLVTATAITPQAEQFTEKDRLYLTDALKRIEGAIVDQHRLTEAQTRAMHDGFEEIKEATNRIGKKDWISYASGLLF